MNLTRRHARAGPVGNQAICPGAAVKPWLWLRVAVTPAHHSARSRTQRTRR